MTSEFPLCSSAISRAISLASVPELVKKLLRQFPGDRRARRSASSTIGWFGNMVVTCWRVSTCSRIAWFTSGWQ